MSALPVALPRATMLWFQQQKVLVTGSHVLLGTALWQLVEAQACFLPHSFDAQTLEVFKLQKPFAIKARRQLDFYQSCLSSVLLAENGCRPGHTERVLNKETKGILLRW